MSEHVATIIWERTSKSFGYKEYNRRHLWRVDAGFDIMASAAPTYLGDEDCIDPEEAFVASLSSCHMLTFLAIASKKRLVVDKYEDKAVGHMEKNAEGRLAVTRVDLYPRIGFADGTLIDAETLSEMHHAAHEHCFIANSVTTKIVINDQD